MKRRHQQHGFTLLELTLASVMAAVLALALYASMVVAFRARSSVLAQTEAVREAAIVLDLLERELQSVPPPTGVLAGPFVGYATGTSGAEADWVEFHALGMDTLDTQSHLSEGMRRVRLELRPAGDAGVLVRAVQRNLLGQVATASDEEVMSRSVRSFALRYYNGYGWQDEWDSTQLANRLPMAVEVTIELNHPTPGDASRAYRATRIIPLSAGRPLPAGMMGGGL
jgi:type II secretion system protein J